MYTYFHCNSMCWSIRLVLLHLLGVKSEDVASEDPMAIDGSEQGEPASPVRAAASSHQG